MFGTRFSHPERVSAEAEKLHAHILRDQRFVRSTAFDLNHEGKMDELCRLLHRMRSTFARNSALKDQLQSHSGLVNDETIYSSLFYFFLCTTKFRKRRTDAEFSDTDFFPTCRHILLKSSTWESWVSDHTGAGRGNNSRNNWRGRNSRNSELMMATATNTSYSVGLCQVS